MSHHYYQLRFRKEGDLCWIGHHDLSRAMERTFRRAALPLAMSRGFSPKPRLAFPSALGLGIAGWDEVCEAELTEHVPSDELHERLGRHAPPGLTITSAKEVAEQAEAAFARAVEYELPIPAERRAGVQAALERLLAQPEHWITREDQRGRCVDLRADILHLELAEGVLHIRLRVKRTATARPREVLAALEIMDLERAPGPLARTKVELDD
jgi:radical SAM-linked protein